MIKYIVEAPKMTGSYGATSVLKRLPEGNYTYGVWTFIKDWAMEFGTWVEADNFVKSLDTLIVDQFGIRVSSIRS